MANVQWARSSQFNWVFDNMGGAPLQEAVAGVWSNAASTVAPDGQVVIGSPNPGGGRVCLVRGVWRKETAFSWDGFWAEPMSGDLVNYYSGGSFTNQGEETRVQLGTPLAPETQVQLYYLYLTGEKAAKYEALNTYPCIRRACRSRDDYTYDFAVDRILDLMAVLHFAGEAQGRDYSSAIKFLWDACYARQESRIPPLVHDTFERRFWDRGGHLMYRGATTGVEAFSVFQTELAPGSASRALHVRAGLAGTGDSAWFGYGLDWSLEDSPFSEIDRVRFKLLGPAETRRLHHLSKVGTGSATLVLKSDYLREEKSRFVVQAQTTGSVGVARFRWSRNGGETWEGSDLTTGDAQHPVALWGGVEVYWEGGPGTHLAAGDYWTFWGGDPEEHPRRLLVILNDSFAADPDPWGPAHTYIHAAPDRFSGMTAWEIPFSQFWRRDNIIDDGDRVRANWGAWYAAAQPGQSDITLCDREETETLLGETFYTQRQVTWNLAPQVTSFGVWVGIDPQRVDSRGRTNVNFLLKPIIPEANSLTVRVKVKDAQGSYFYRDVSTTVNAWQRVTVNLEEMELESGSWPLTHPLQAADIGVPANPPLGGAWLLTDLKFDEHLTFTDVSRLRLLEFRLEQQGLPEHEWWLDEVGLNLVSEDPYPYVPRLAISLTPYGQNPWRGPTLAHYAHPLASYLAGALDLTQNYVHLHRDAQVEFNQRYGGVKGPIVPVHTRNDIENIALMGCEAFNRFSWWSKYRNYGKVMGFWHFNGALTDASGKSHALTWRGGGNPVYAPGVCQPGDTAVTLDGSSKYLTAADHADLDMGTEDFTIEAVFQRSQVSLSYHARLVSKRISDIGYEIYIRNDNRVSLWMGDSSGHAVITPDPPLRVNDTENWHYLGISVDRDGQITFCLDGTIGSAAAVRPGSLDNTVAFTVGRYSVSSSAYFPGGIDLIRLHKGRVLSSQEMQDNWQIIQGALNGSAYPEVGCGLGQYWAFYRLAHYYFVSGDTNAWTVLDNWLTWLNTFGTEDGEGWKFPMLFSEFGFHYGAYDPGQTAAITIGCLWIYLRRGDDRAGLWARRILDDLRENRLDPEFGGYKSDYHYAWLNALVLQAFGLAVNGRTGQAYEFGATQEDRDHFEALLSWLFSRSGDGKPNLLNEDLIPFSFMEDADLWDYAPHYMAVRQMGSTEALVLMLGAALEYALAQGDWSWFQRLLDFILVENRLALGPAQIQALTLAYDQAGLKNLVRLRYADYDRDPAKYAEARDEEAVAARGEAAVDVDFRYGGSVILENPDVAQLLAARLLKRLSVPWEQVEVETWLEGVRVEMGNAVELSSDFHGLCRQEFSLFGKEVDLSRRRVRLNLNRPLNLAWSWAVDSPGTAQDSWAIDQASTYDPNWKYRAYA